MQSSASEAKSEQTATTSASAIMGSDVKKVAEDVGETKELLEKRNQRAEKVEEAIQEHAKKI